MIQQSARDEEVLGVTLGWNGRPTRVFRWPDGFVGIIPGDIKMRPEYYDATGWPIDAAGQRLPIHDYSRKPTLLVANTPSRPTTPWYSLRRWFRADGS